MVKTTTVKKMSQGYAPPLYKSPTYNSWAGLKNRCNCEKAVYYKNYGGRGIKYDEKWESFEGFLSDMGIAPEGCSLDRIDVNGDYCKENCRWATKSQQQRNTRFQNDPLVGVRYDKAHNGVCHWACRINAKGKQYASRFKTKKEAVAWRKSMEDKLWARG